MSLRRIAIVLALTAPAAAQPAKPKPPAAKLAGKAKPIDPYADPKPGKPVDPYAEPPAPKPPKVAAVTKVKPGRPGARSATSGKPEDPYAEPPKPAPIQVPKRIELSDVAAVQGLLAVQRLGGWLLHDRDGQNPIAARLVAPDGRPSRPWFYLVPVKGAPIVLAHETEAASFAKLAGTKLTYGGYRDLDKQLRTMLKGVRSVAVEYSAKASVPRVSRVDAGTLELIRSVGTTVRSSDTLVQYTMAIWGEAGRTAHHVAAHHLTELRKEALGFIAAQVRAGAPVTEYDVQQRLARGMQMRGLVGPAPRVAAGVNTADPTYVPSAARTAPIRRGDLVVLSLAGKLDKPDGVFAAHTWNAVVDASARDDIEQAFVTATLARDQALSLIGDRARKKRPLTGAEVDASTRAFLKKAGVGAKVLHRTGHSIDTELHGSGADLDDFEVRDTRVLTPGTGVTVGPGVYTAGQFGVRAEVSVYLSPAGPEVTTPMQEELELLLLAPPS